MPWESPGTPWGALGSSGTPWGALGDPGGALGDSGGALGDSGGALGDRGGALGDPGGALGHPLGGAGRVNYIHKLPINRPSGRYVNIHLNIYHICSIYFKQTPPEADSLQHTPANQFAEACCLHHKSVN